MDIEEVLQILSLLADGINPETHERIPSDSPYHQSSCVRALFHAINFIGRYKGKEKSRSAALAKKDERMEKRIASGLVNQGQPWTPEEEEKLLKGFDEGVSVQELAGIHQRSRYGIQSRLAILGRVDVAQGVFPRGVVESYKNLEEEKPEQDGYDKLVEKVFEF